MANPAETCGESLEIEHMKPDVLVLVDFHPPTTDAVAAEFNAHKFWLAQNPDAFIAGIANKVRGVLTSGISGIGAGIIARLPKLELIASIGVGVDTIDLDAARRRGIVVTNTPDLLNDCVADLAMGLTIATLRRISAGDRFVRAGRWLKASLPLASKVGDKTMGILGYGRIGKAIAKRAEAFGMRIVYHGRRQQPGVAYKYYANLIEMARACDVLMVICAGGKETYHIVNTEVLNALGPEGTLINVARGSVVDEQALIKALADGSLGGAGLDVFEAEPRVPEVLFAMDNVVLQPHVGSATLETRQAMGDLAAENLRAYFSGRPVLTPVN